MKHSKMQKRSTRQPKIKMNNTTKIGTLNLCLGLINKKLLVKNLIITENIDILCMQEIDVKNDYNVRLLTLPGMNLEIEDNTVKARTGIYITSKINYTRRKDLEGRDSNLIIVDVTGSSFNRIINVYRNFNPQGGVPARVKFNYQLEIIGQAFNKDTLLLGDFNLDYSRYHDISYSHKNFFEDFDRALGMKNLVQLIDFPTWSRCVDAVMRESILDHFYVQHTRYVKNIACVKPIFGDHLCVMVSTAGRDLNTVITQRRDWRKYNKDVLINTLRTVDWTIEDDTVQEYWNTFENKLIQVVDQLIPIRDFVNNSVKLDVPRFIKSKINLRNRLLKQLKRVPTIDLKTRISKLNKEVKSHFYREKTKNVRRGIIPGNSKSLWSAVRVAEDTGSESIPNRMKYVNKVVTGQEVADCFAYFFDTKVRNIVNSLRVDPGVYNGVRKLNSQNAFFMSRKEIMDCVNTIKMKNCEGYDRIPQRVLVDGLEILIEPLIAFFSLVYRDVQIPGQWLISKITPVHKKGSKSEIANYRPIANLCSTSKIFEKLILTRIRALEILNGINLAGDGQHGFQKSKSTVTAGLALQSLISRALEDDNYVAMASLDLSAAFDVVDVNLLTKRLKIIGLPDDLLGLIKVWLNERNYYVTVGGFTSAIVESWYGIIQGSILGPILYAIFVSPLWDIEPMICYADDNFPTETDKCKIVLKQKIESKLDSIATWLTQSGLKVNEEKTDLCIFHKNDSRPFTINLKGKQITSKPSMNVLGITFDAKLHWDNQVCLAITKSRKALCAINMIRKYFTNKELLQVVTANFYSVLYYGSEIWHIPSLKTTLKQKLLSASSLALKTCSKQNCDQISFINLHRLNMRATPENLMLYKHAILLYKLYNCEDFNFEWQHLNNMQILTSRQTNFLILRGQLKRVGINALANRLFILNGRIPLSWLGQSLGTFKIKCKKIFL